MNLMLVLKSGVKYLVIATIAVVISALTLSLGFVPSGALYSTIWQYIVLPLIAGIVGALNNYLKHLKD